MAVRAKAIVKYGITFRPIKGPKGKLLTCPDWLVEKQILAAYDKCKEFKSARLMRWEEHFCRLVDIIFHDPAGIFYFQWNPNALRILKNFHRHDILSVSGHASSSKSETSALLAVMMFFLDPKNTKILVTSTTVSSAQEKIWGKVKQIWNHLCKFFGGEQNLPGKLLDSKNKIRYQDGDLKSELSGITLVVGEKSRMKESAEKIQGTKQGKVILIGDEFATLEHSLVTTALTNLSSNPNFKLLGGFNPDSYFDPGGIISRPAKGWHTITEQDDEWATEIEPFGIKGYCIRFDGEKSPNIIAGYEKWKGLLKPDKLAQYQAAGTKTREYYKMVRGYWSPTGMADAIYSEADIFRWRADSKVTSWIEPPIMVAGLDPAFTHGGDRAVLVIGKVGYVKNTDTGQVQKVFELVKIYTLDHDITNTTISKTEWVVKLAKEKMAEHKVDVKNLAVDATGGGDPFCALIARDIGLGSLNVKFSGKASDKPVSRNDTRKGFERFRSLVSELWYVGKELIRTGQIKGLLPDVITEMVSRTYKESGGIVVVESKDDMKARTRKSPDCFVAGTLVSTSNGDVKIENITVGNYVLTPFGPQKVIAIHKTQTASITTAVIGDRHLAGKGAHKIFVENLGWERLDKLCIGSNIESVENIHSWNFLNSYFTRAENIDFKHLVDIIKTRTGSASQKDFFTGSFGLKIMALFLKDIASITRTAIGQITPLKIWNQCQLLITPKCTWMKDSKIQTLFCVIKRQLPKLEKLLKRGTLHLRGWLGIPNMPTKVSRTPIENQSKEIVPSVEKNSTPLWVENFAPSVVGIAPTEKGIKRYEFASFALLSLAFSNSTKRNLAVKSVHQQSDGQTDVYNLTLERENVYYANGFLVQNCADAVFLSIHLARIRHGLSSNETAAPRQVSRQNPANALFPPWNPNKRQEQQARPAMLDYGGGWASGIT